MFITTVPDAIRLYKESKSTLRQLERRGGRTGATTKAIGRHQRNVIIATNALIGHGLRSVVGDLVEEANLRDRLHADPERPELYNRLRETERRIRYDLDLYKATDLIARVEVR
jgi:hypothetical protein